MLSKMVLNGARAVLLLFACIMATLTHAEKDSNFYRKGITNPNTRHPMYWNNAQNVLDDLSSFSSLYIQFHSCV
jgi:hypothetical protein